MDDNLTPNDRAYDEMIAKLRAQPTPESAAKDRVVSQKVAQDQAVNEDVTNEDEMDEAMWNEMPEMDQDDMFDPCADPWGDCYGLGGFVASCRCNREHPK